MLSFVVNPANPWRLVAELYLNMVSDKPVLVENDAGGVAEAVPGMTSFVPEAAPAWSCVLVAEDNPVNREILKEQLEALGEAGDLGRRK